MAPVTGRQVVEQGTGRSADFAAVLAFIFGQPLQIKKHGDHGEEVAHGHAKDGAAAPQPSAIPALPLTVSGAHAAVIGQHASAAAAAGMMLPVRADGGLSGSFRQVIPIYTSRGRERL